MAEPKTLAEAANKPGIGMRLTISMIGKKFSNVKQMSTEELSARLTEPTESDQDLGASPTQRNLILLDCRDEEEYNVSHIKDAIRVNPGDEAKNIVKAVDDLKLRGSHDVVCYCSVGYRSSDVAQKLTRYFKPADSESHPPTCYNLEGSLFKWANERRPMVDTENQPTSFAHPYNAVFGKLLDSALRKHPT